MRKMNWIGTIVLCLIASLAYAQPKKEVREGNKLYKEQKYKEATAEYQKAIQKQPNYIPGLFNLGNAQYKQKEFEASRKIYEGTAKTAKEKDEQAAANYNIGNTYLEEKKYKEAVEAYKEALRKDPQDEQAKYNLSYALQMLKNQQGGGGKDKNKNEDKKDDKQDKQDKNKDENKDENKDKQDQENKDKKDGDKDKQDQQQQDQQDKKGDKEEKEKRPKPQPSKLSEQQAEQLLNALQQEEKKLQDKMKQGKAVPIKVEKDW
ncbi:MAG: tetratricopeptide repeat protein [Chitinophagales bacterium]|nr:tetratricopeptide repeat protein [Chitinophagales bacterium]